MILPLQRNILSLFLYKFSFLFIGITNVNAQTTEKTITEEVKEECPFTTNKDGKKICTKTGKLMKNIYLILENVKEF